MKIDYSLYLCTDRNLNPNIEKAVELAIKGGVTVVQLREKNCTSREFFDIGTRLKKITDSKNIPLIVNDRLDIAQAIDAAGVHVGQTDLLCKVARKILGAEKIIGVSVSTVEEAVQAEIDGANYLGVGAMFATNTKTDAKLVTLDTLKKIRAAVKIPIVAIGGINLETVAQIKPAKIDGVAVVSAIIAAENPEIAARNLREIGL
ncbi:MAG: thiamine phosphate synthase [Selenomonadaceae bacterium]|nr:thiamine phosphate synthase [Selenomonadaceae bacterium]